MIILAFKQIFCVSRAISYWFHLKMFLKSRNTVSKTMISQITSFILCIVTLPVLNIACLIEGSKIDPLSYSRIEGENQNQTQIKDKPKIEVESQNSYGAEKKPEKESEEIITNINTAFVKNFKNIDNACFMHTALQVLICILLNLYTLDELKQKINALDSALRNKKSIESLFTLEFLKIVKNYLKKGTLQISYENVTKPFRVLMTKIYPNISMKEQHDSSEFFVKTLEVIKKAQSDSAHKKLFEELYMKIVSTLTCLKCGVGREKMDPLQSTIELPIQPGNSLNQLFDAYFTSEGMYDVDCPTCKEKLVHGKQLEIFEYPKILTIILKRYDNLGEKLNYLIKYNKDLTLKTVKYKLIAVGMHDGLTPDFGHYTAYTNMHNKWYFTNDMMRNDCPNEVHNDKQLNQEDAMMLVYKRQE